MCLTTVDEKKPKSEGYFWKILSRRGKDYRWLIFSSCPVRKKGIWYRARKERIGFSDGYISGFHGFETKKGAIEWWGNPIKGIVIKKCKYRKGRLKGLQGYRFGNRQPQKAIVADEMMIL